jgi:hypothetical protein
VEQESQFSGWAIVELMGHRKLGGYIKEETIAGSSFLRLDVCTNNGKTATTQFYSPSSVYCITPTTEQIARDFGTNHQPTPVTRWELPSASIAQKDLLDYSDSESERDPEEEYQF